MLPNVRTFLGTMFVAAVLAALVGLVLVPAPGDPYIQSTGFPAVGQTVASQSEGPDSQQFRLLGYARRSDELNRLLNLSKLPAPMRDDATKSATDSVAGAASTPQQDGDDTHSPAPAVAALPDSSAPAAEAKQADTDVRTTEPSTTTENQEKPAEAQLPDEPATTSSIPDPKIATKQPGSGEAETTETKSEHPTEIDSALPATLTTMPPAKPKWLGLRHAQHKATAVDANGRPTSNPGPQTQRSPSTPLGTNFP
jgi:hypothetical protein